MLDACVIGHVVRDINTIRGVEHAPLPGGAAHYATMVYRRLGLRVAVVTAVAAPDEPLLLGELRAAGVEVFNLGATATTTFRNDYPSDDPDLRVQRVHGRAAPITVALLPAIQARIWQLGPLTAGDIEPAMVGHCARGGGLVGMDVQGLTRTVVGGEVRAAPPAARMDDIRDLAVLKADDDEIRTYTGTRTVADAVARVRAAGVREVLITHGSRGSTVFGAAGSVAIGAVPPRQTVDATGCGDTYLAAYLARRTTSDDLRDCGEFAAAAAALNLEHLGAFQGTATGINERRQALARR
jgi:sugar/nucleoside kinase (ribokinase family)